jgi:hypothetical protein
MRIAPFVLILAAAAPAFAGSFNGVVEMSFSNDKHPGGGTHKLSIGDGGMLSELHATDPAMGAVDRKTLIKRATPDKAYMIDDASKSYAEITIPPPQSDASETWTVKKLGNEKIAGYDSVHAMATSSTGKSIELWAAKDIMDAAEFDKAQGGQKLPAGLMKAMKDAGADGFLAKIVQKGPDGSTTTMQVTKVTKGGVPASTFDIPSGYAKKDPQSLAMPPDMQKKIEEKMKSLTPEQRAAMEKALQGQGAAPPPGH